MSSPTCQEESSVLQKLQSLLQVIQSGETPPIEDQVTNLIDIIGKIKDQEERRNQENKLTYDFVKAQAEELESLQDQVNVYENTIDGLEKQNIELKTLVEERSENLGQNFSEEQIETMVEEKVIALRKRFEEIEEDYNEKVEKINSLLESQQELEEFLEYKSKELKELALEIKNKDSIISNLTLQIKQSDNDKDGLLNELKDIVQKTNSVTLEKNLLEEKQKQLETDIQLIELKKSEFQRNYEEIKEKLEKSLPKREEIRLSIINTCREIPQQDGSVFQANMLSFIDDVTPRASTLRRKNTGERSRLSVLGGKSFGNLADDLKDTSCLFNNINMTLIDLLNDPDQNPNASIILDKSHGYSPPRFGKILEDDPTDQSNILETSAQFASLKDGLEAETEQTHESSRSEAKELEASQQHIHLGAGFQDQADDDPLAPKFTIEDGEIGTTNLIPGQGAKEINKATMNFQEARTHRKDRARRDFMTSFGNAEQFFTVLDPKIIQEILPENELDQEEDTTDVFEIRKSHDQHQLKQQNKLKEQSGNQLFSVTSPEQNNSTNHSLAGLGWEPKEKRNEKLELIEGWSSEQPYVPRFYASPQKAAEENFLIAQRSEASQEQEYNPLTGQQPKISSLLKVESEDRDLNLQEVPNQSHLKDEYNTTKPLASQGSGNFSG